jgi:hypothetical protein
MLLGVEGQILGMEFHASVQSFPSILLLISADEKQAASRTNSEDVHF